MLLALTIKDFAIIDELSLDFAAGLTVITGETGAGKSILIDALNLVLGGRARTEVVRSGADKANVEALFEIDEAARARLLEAGIEADAQLVVRRVVSRSGRHRVYINGTLATVAMLAAVTGGLVDISGQHEHYSLLRAEYHLDLLDRVGQLGTARSKVANAHQAVAAHDARLEELRTRQRDRAEREDFIRFQLQDLHAAELGDPTEEDDLDAESRRLANLERLRDAANGAESELYSAKGAATERLSRALRHVETLADLDDSLAPLVEDLSSALAIAEDAARTLADYERTLSAEPERLQEIEDRLGVFTRLRRKYGATLADVITRQQEMEAELAELSGSEGAATSLRAERDKAAEKLLAAADKLTAARRVAAKRFVAAVQAELVDLGMERAVLEVHFDDLSAGCEVQGRCIGPRGAERIELRLSANPGEVPQPLARIASGGELSRFMLAVKRVIAERDPVSTYVFDEVDSGVGGPTAQAIGHKLRAVSAQRQALCITHLPQIAAMGDHHWFVSKVIQDDRTMSQVTVLTHKQRVDELARMLGGAKITATTRAAAEELLTLRG